MKETAPCPHRLWVDVLDRASDRPFQNADPKCANRQMADCTPEQCPLEEVKKDGKGKHRAG